jgi:hypothetical protein
MKKIVLMIVAASLFSATALAGQAVDEDEAFDDAVRNFGYISGLAHQCVPEEKQGAVERRVVQAYSRIVGLFGSDQAFFFAAAFGAGSTAQFDRQECKKHLDFFEEQLNQNAAKK